MRFIFYNFKLKKDLDRIKVLHGLHFGLVLVALFSEYIYGYNSLMQLVGKGALLLFFYRVLYKTKRGLYYSFWTFSGFLLLYLIVGLLHGVVYSLEGIIFNCYLLALIFFFLETYILSSPIYFPRVNWWEYDFRYKDDLKVHAHIEGEEFDARLTDLRRGAGCVVLFQNLKIGDVFTIKTPSDSKVITLKAEVMSKRIYSVGRAVTYGVKFHFDDEELKKNFSQFSKYWKTERKNRKKMKFELEVKSENIPV